MMKNFFLLFISIFIFSKSFSQQYISNPNFGNATMVHCAGDTSVMVHGFPGWTFYQTTNDEWDGAIDTNICINAFPFYPNNTAIVALSEIDTMRRLFIATDYDSSSNVEALKNWVYDIQGQFQPKDFSHPFQIEQHSFCSGPCSYFIAQIKRPDSTHTSYSDNFVKVGIDSSWSWQNMWCFPTEKMDSQFIRRFVAALKVTHVHAADSLLVFNFDIQPYDLISPFSPPILYDSIVANGGTGNWYFDFNPVYPNIIAYHDSTYPTWAHQSFVNVIPGNNLDTSQQTIDLNFYSGTLLYQPQTQLRGAPVLNHPGLFHNFNLNMFGGNMCMAMFGDRVMDPGNNLNFHGGTFDFGGILSCWVFKNGAAFNITENATCNYGTINNLGIMGLRENSIINIERNATLNIFNRMVILEQVAANGAKQFYMTLNPTSTLRFMPGSHLCNWYSVDNTILLNVYMKGGVLDDSGLPDDEKWMINRIYEPSDIVPSKLTVYPNPAAEQTTVLLNSPEDEDATLMMIDALGRIIKQQTLHLQKGINEETCFLDDTTPGVYVLKVIYSNNNSSLVNQVVKIH